MQILKKTLILIITCSLLTLSVGAEEPVIEETETPLVYNTEEENTVNANTDTTVVADDENAEDVVDNSADTDNVEASTPENNISSEPAEEVSNTVEDTPTIELGEFKNKVTYNEEHTVATIVVEYLGECTELNLVNEEIIQQMVNTGVYQVNLEKGGWINKIAFDVLVNGIVPLEINVWNEDTLVGTKMVMTSVTGLNNEALIFEPNQSSTYEITSSDVGSTDSRNMTLSYETNVSFTWSIPTELSMAGIEDDLTVTVNNSNLATETALRIRVSSNNDNKLIDSASGESLSYIIKDLSGNKLDNGDVILDHLYSQDSTFNTIHFGLTQMPVMSGKYEDTLTFTASVERMLSDLYSGQTITIPNLGTTHNLTNMKIYGVSKQDGTPTPDNPIEIQGVVNPLVKVFAKFNQFVNGNVIEGNKSFIGQHLVTSNIEVGAFTGVTNTFTNPIPAGHKTLLIIKCISGNVGNKSITLGGYHQGAPGSSWQNEYILPTNTDLSGKTYFKIATTTDTTTCFYHFLYGSDSIAENLDLYINLFDLTAMGLESITTLEEFKALYPDDYYSYDEGSYYEQSATMDYTLNAIPVSNGGNVVVNGQQYISDYIDIDRKKLVRNIYTTNVEINMAEDNYISKGIFYFTTSHINIPMYKYGNVANFLSTHYKFNGPFTSVSFLNDLEFMGYKDGSEFAFKDTSRITKELWEEVTNDGLQIYYQLATPIEIDLTDEQVQPFKDLYTYSPTTIVSVSSEQLTPYIEFGLS